MELCGASKLDATDDVALQEVPGPRRVESGGLLRSSSVVDSGVWHESSLAEVSLVSFSTAGLVA